MALEFDKSYLSALVDVGADAHQNLFYAQFVPYTNTTQGYTASEENMELSVRLQSFTTPTKNQESYTNKFLTEYLERPAAKIRMERSFTLKFRVDSNYMVYKKILQQQGVTFNPGLGYVTTDIKKLMERNSLFTVKLFVVKEALSSEEVKFKQFAEYQNCWIDHVDPLSFDYKTSRPLVVNLGVKFIESEDWQSLDMSETLISNEQYKKSLDTKQSSEFTFNQTASGSSSTPRARSGSVNDTMSTAYAAAYNDSKKTLQQTVKAN